jgi:hypothetical protein
MTVFGSDSSPLSNAEHKIVGNDCVEATIISQRDFVVRYFKNEGHAIINLPSRHLFLLLGPIALAFPEVKTPPMIGRDEHRRVVPQSALVQTLFSLREFWQEVAQERYPKAGSPKIIKHALTETLSISVSFMARKIPGASRQIIRDHAAVGMMPAHHGGSLPKDCTLEKMFGLALHLTGSLSPAKFIISSSGPASFADATNFPVINAGSDKVVEPARLRAKSRNAALRRRKEFVNKCKVSVNDQRLGGELFRATRSRILRGQYRDRSGTTYFSIRFNKRPAWLRAISGRCSSVLISRSSGNSC